MSEYKPGDVANGYVWTGQQWLPLAQQPAPTPALPVSPEMSRRQKRDTLVIVGGITAALVAFVVIAAALGWLRQSGKPADYSDEVWAACKDRVTAQLKAPATADFPWQVDANITHVGDQYTVRSYVDAENGFGANIRTNFVCTATVTGGKVTATATLSG